VQPYFCLFTAKVNLQVFDILSNQDPEIDTGIPFHTGIGVLLVKKGMAALLAFVESHDPGVFILVKFKPCGKPVCCDFRIHLQKFFFQIFACVSHHEPPFSIPKITFSETWKPWSFPAGIFDEPAEDPGTLPVGKRMDK
jgi:hypothetical protein